MKVSKNKSNIINTTNTENNIRKIMKMKYEYK
jgi:hypothetical protein